MLDKITIEKKNKAFLRMSKKKQRLAIAADVLAQLKAKQYIASPGTYLFVEGNDQERGTGPKFLQDLLIYNEKKVKCHVCAIGAAFCSLAKLGDHEVLRTM